MMNLRLLLLGISVAALLVGSACSGSTTSSSSSPRPGTPRAVTHRAKEVILARARIDTPDGDVEDAFPSASVFCEYMADLGSNTTGTSYELSIRQNNLEARLSVSHVADGTSVEVLQRTSAACGGKGGLQSPLSLVRTATGLRGWVFSEHLNPPQD